MDRKTIPVIFCTYKRLEYLDSTLNQLAQQINCPIKVFIWNNNPKKRELVDSIVSTHPEMSIEVQHSEQNIGGFGRFYFARRLSSRYPAVIFIDDDVRLNANSLSTLVEEFEPHTIHSFYAFKFKTKKDYFKRKNLKFGDEADYCGTGGMICDTSIFKQKNLFNCPKPYWFVEDLWLSYYAKQILGWKLYKSEADIKLLPDDKDQWVSLAKTKTQFLQYLITKGWELPHLDKKWPWQRN